MSGDHGGAVLVLNSGSSSVKYQLVVPATQERLATGIVERIGEHDSVVEHRCGDDRFEVHDAVADHRDALSRIIVQFDEHGPRLADAGIVAVGHRVVMGGRHFNGPVRIDDDVVATIDALSPLAPLHNPHNLEGIAVARERFPDVPHVAVFDTAFFHGLPAVAATYAIDRGVAEQHHIRRYGFHGTSHHYVSEKVADVLGRSGRNTDGLRQIVLHLGNGASASAVVGGRPVETSMGLTPLEGLVMGTRSGDLDPAIVVHLHRNAGMGIDAIDDLLNRRSGMRGLAGDNDMREVHRLIDQGHDDARLALDVYVHRLRKYIGAYAAVMGGLDALTFTAGVGEHDPIVRAETCAALGFLGIRIDPERNTAEADGPRVISPDGAPVAVLVVPTDEELMIARQTMDVLATPPQDAAD